MIRDLDIEGSYNVRDLGGYPTADGRTTRPQVFIRAGNLNEVSPAAQQKLIDYGVRTVIDLRSPWETERMPNVFAQSDKVKYLNLSLFDLSPKTEQERLAKTDSSSGLSDLYLKFLNHARPQVTQVMSVLAESDSTALFHCHAGKDRTGIIAALLLALVGVPEELIVEDYALTTSRIAHLIPIWREQALAHGVDLERFNREMTAEAETMRGMLRHIEAEYGGITEYLLGCGLTQPQLDALKARFVE